MSKASFGKSIIAGLALAAATFFAVSTGIAASKSGEEARTIPTGVFELLVGGSWEHQKQSGYYRAIALGAGKAGKEYAEVWLQWISVGKKSAKVLKNIPLTEVSKLQIPSLSLNLDVEESGSVVVAVTHYDEDSGEPMVLEFRASSPGTYKALETQVASDDTAESSDEDTTAKE